VFITIGLLVVGLALLVKGGDLFVSASVRIAELFHLPRIVIGTTLVSLATTTPELTVSIISGLQGVPELAIGNAIGSCICNLGLIVGVSAVMRRVELDPAALRVPLSAMLGAAGILFLVTLDLRLGRAEGFLLLAMGFAYVVYDFRRHWRSRARAEAAEARELEKGIVVSSRWLRSPGGAALQFLLGSALVVVGARLLVGSAVAIAQNLGVPTVVIGLSVVAVGTSIPELVTAITASRRGVSDLGVANVVGANIANLTFITGTAAVLTSLSLSRSTQLLSFPALFAGMIVLVVAVVTGREVTRLEGAVLLLYYAVYLAALIAVAGVEASS